MESSEGRKRFSMKINTNLKIFILLGIGVLLSAQTCTMKLVRGRDYYTQPRTQSFEVGMTEMMDVVKKTLDKEGFQIFSINKEQKRFITGWLPVEADSHYLYIFNRKDYGLTDGSYYQLYADLSQEGQKVKVALSTKVKTIVGQLESSHKVERRLLRQIEDYVRAPQLDMTNVGTEKKK